MDTKTIQQIQSKTDELLANLGIEGVCSVIEVDESQVVKINITTDSEEDQQNLGILIGRGGETLQSLQLILALIINKDRPEWLQIAVDIDGYRGQREEALRALALRLAEKVKFLNEPLPVRPMSAMDRRIIHLTLSEVSGVETESTGEGRARHIVIKPS